MTDLPLNVCKRLLYAAKQVSTDIKGADVASMIYMACERGFEQLSKHDQAHVQEAVNLVQAKFNRIGPKGALELIASVAQYLEGSEG